MSKRQKRYNLQVYVLRKKWKNKVTFSHFQRGWFLLPRPFLYWSRSLHLAVQVALYAWSILDRFPERTPKKVRTHSSKWELVKLTSSIWESNQILDTFAQTKGKWTLPLILLDSAVVRVILISSSSFFFFSFVPTNCTTVTGHELKGEIHRYIWYMYHTCIMYHVSCIMNHMIHRYIDMIHMFIHHPHSDVDVKRQTELQLELVQGGLHQGDL